MEKYLVSFVIPVYNVEKYLNKSVTSVLNQTYKNIEVLLIDDGSTDSSPKLCDEFAKEDERVKVFHQKNAGPGMARNTGLQNAKGDYLIFVDSDDYIISTYVEETLKIAQQYNADIVEVGSVSMDPLSDRYVYSDGKLEVFEGSQTLVKDYFSSCGKLQNTLWSRLFDLRKIRDVRFSNKSVGEDSEFCLKALSRCDIFVKYNKPLYAYRCYNESITRSKLTSRHFDTPEIVLRDILFCESICVEPDSWDDVIGKFTHSVSELLKRVAKENQENNFTTELDKIKKLYDKFESIAQRHDVKLDKSNLDIINNIESWSKQYRKDNRINLLLSKVKILIKSLASKYKVKINYEFDIEALK